MANGILIIDKPQDWTSMDVCAKLRGVFHEKRVGHGGTLDPMATGVLPVFIGRATRAVEFATDSDKEYITGLQLGVITNTQDLTGEVLETRPVPVSREDLAALLPRFTGPLEQIPPMYSAIKIGGKKLYELARKGREVERKARKITVYELELLEEGIAGGPFPAELPPDTYLLRIRCSKGTYVRTLCHDIGQALGCGGCMSFLRRSMAGGFFLAESHSLEEVVNHPDPTSLLLPVDKLFSHLPSLTLKAQGEKKVRNGVSLSTPKLKEGEYRVYGESGSFLALSRCERGRLVTVKSFFEPADLSL